MYTKRLVFALVVVVVFLCGIWGWYTYDAHVSLPTASTAQVSGTMLFAGGCFWCVEADFEKLPGVVSVVSGYAGGTLAYPDYENYAEYGHREVVQVTYDTSLLSYENLVEYGIKHSDPTDPDGSFYDRGIEYAPAIYYADATEKMFAEKMIAEIDASGVYEKPLAIALLPRVVFWPAEEYHQDYYKKNPIRYAYYRNASGRDAFVKKHWGESPRLWSRGVAQPTRLGETDWSQYKKPSLMDLQKKLTPLQYTVTQEGGTEKPFDNEYNTNKAEGIYVDVVSGEPLFLSSDKYDSGTGWPSFVKPITLDAVVTLEDKKLLSTRVEVRSRHADSHLGHVFDDGPVDRGGKRYCMNSSALRFIPKERMEEEGYGKYLGMR